jgi:glycosyltransferase involved in cell wall biosynthesis
MRPSGGMSIEWQVAVFCHNERGRIAACLASIAAAIGTRRGLITLLLNGSTDGSEAAARAAAAALAVEVQLFSIPHADKSNAINAFIHQLRADAALYLFVDGAVTIGRNAIAAAEARLAVCPDALAASGVAGNGRTEIRTNRAAVEEGGILRGQFFALRPGFVARMAAGGIRLPIGLYRGDGLLGSMAAHDLDPSTSWENARVIGVADAVFDIDALSPFRVRDLRRQFARKIRQMRGRVENAAIRQIIYAHGYAALPAYADDMIADFLATHPVPAVGLPDRPFMALALARHRAAVRPAAADLQPRRLA